MAEAAYYPESETPIAHAPHMTRPRRYLLRMAIFLGLVVAVGVALYRPLLRIFLTNPAINGLIFFAAALGVFYAFRQIFRLNRNVDWIEAFFANRPSADGAPPPMLAPVASLLRERKGRLQLSAISMRSILDVIGSRLDESRDISRYLIRLLIFLGLLGTFWGLLQTVRAVGDTIGALTIGSEGDAGAMFDTLRAGLEAPLSGMGTAFASSLFGLAGSLVLGFLDLQTSQAQNRFYNDLEERLSELTRLSSGAVGVEGDQSVPAYVSALLEQTADGLEGLQRIMVRAEENRGSANAALMALSERLATLTDQMRAEQQLMTGMAQSQADLRPVLERIGATLDERRSAIDDATRNHIRNLDVYVMRLLEEAEAGRHQMTSELRGEIKLLTKTIAALADRRV